MSILFSSSLQPHAIRFYSSSNLRKWGPKYSPQEIKNYIYIYRSQKLKRNKKHVVEQLVCFHLLFNPTQIGMGPISQAYCQISGTILEGFTDVSEIQSSQETVCSCPFIMIF